MAKTVNEIADPRSKALCLILEEQLRQWRAMCELVARFPQDLTVFLNTSPFIREIGLEEPVRKALPAINSLVMPFLRQRQVGAARRCQGFDARRRGVPITANPYVTIDASIPGKPYIRILSHDAISWHVGWKQGARAGEDHFP